MTVTRLKAVLTLAVVLTALAAGAGYSARQVSALERGEVQRADEPAAKGEGVPAPQADKQERTDFYGDPLPPGARVRLGSVQFRHPSANVVFSADGKTLVSGGLDGAVCFWDVATGKRVQRRQLRTPQGSFGRMHVVLVAPGGKVVVAWDNDEEAFLYDTATGKELRRIPTGRNWHRVLFSPDGKFLATTQSAAGHHSILLWDVATGKEHPTLESKRCTGFDVAFASDSERMASLDRDGADAILRVWDTTSGRELRNVRMEQKKNREALSVAFSPDGKAVAVTDRSGAVTLWEAATLQKQGELKPAKAGWTYSCVTAYSPDGASLAVAGDTDLVLWDVAARRELHRLPAWTPQGSTNCLAFTPDGRTLARAGENEVDLWDVATGKRLHDRPGHDRYATSVAVSPDGKVVATASLYDPTVRLWEVATGKPLSPGLRHDSSVRSCDFSSDGKLVITGGATDGTLRFWEPATQKEVRRFVIKDLNNGGEKHEILVCHLTPDGKRLAAISEPLGGGTTPENCQLTVWDARTGEILARRRFAGDLSSRFTPDGKGVTADTVERLVLEEVITGKERLKMWGDLGHPVAFSPDGILLAVGVHKTLPGNQSINGRNLGTENVRVAEVMTGQELFHVDGRINFVAFSRDGRVLATADGEALSLREAVTGRLLFRRPWPRDPAAVSRVFAPLQSLAFHPDGRSVATGMADGTVLIWDTAIEDWPAPTVAPKLDALWTDLAGDTPGACRAVRALTAEPARAVRFLKDHLRPVREADPERVQRLIAELDSDQFAVRKSAGEELAKLGEQIEPALRKALEGQPSPEVRRRITEVLEAMKTAPAADTLRTRRAIQILQRLGTAEARQILQTLATGAPAARETREAREALASLTVTTP
jgi:WD40 repeat protein